MPSKNENLGSSKTNKGNFFEDFHVGMSLKHATPRTVTAGDQALYQALYGSRFVLASSDEFARSVGLAQAPLDDFLAFHLVFGKTVPDISLNAVANLGYAEGRFGVPLFPGDTVTTTSEVIGTKENSNGKTGVVYVRSTGRNQYGEMVLEYVRWVMVRMSALALSPRKSPTKAAEVPDLLASVKTSDLTIPEEMTFAGFDSVLSGSPYLWGDYKVGERIAHVDGMTIEEAEHQMATRLYQNTAKVHFNQHSEGQGRFGRRLIYGGHIISLARSLSFNGMENAVKVVALNGGTHVAPTFAGDTIYAWSEVLEKIELSGRSDVGALRVRLVAAKNNDCGDFPLRDEQGGCHPDVVLDLDYTVLMPR
ncbi:MaoC family dehydratase [Kiloniella laminariae]|uniref:MaoC family dehydratase n=1 Tax=Kiloniella laminariae TaxID=454162 RepID=A0ABT4LMQ5_9PROT|nr:MaoC family dehydratase [Kiloniella laminariae]MCZ4282425.1 MaoC family dehydratase [Kiloniella laminariae]